MTATNPYLLGDISEPLITVREQQPCTFQLQVDEESIETKEKIGFPEHTLRKVGDWSNVTARRTAIRFMQETTPSFEHSRRQEPLRGSDYGVYCGSRIFGNLGNDLYAAVSSQIRCKFEV